MGNIIGKFINVWIHPVASMAAVKEEGEDASIKPALLFIAVLSVLTGIITAIIAMISPPPVVAAGQAPKWLAWANIVLYPLFTIVGSFVFAFLLWILVFGIRAGTMAQYKLSFRMLALLAAFWPIAALLSPIPKVGIFLALCVNTLWAFIVLVRGVIVVTNAPPLRTWIIMIAAVLFMSLQMLAMVGALGIIAGNRPGGTNAGATLGQGQDDFEFDEGALKKELQDLSDKAKGAEKSKNN